MNIVLMDASVDRCISNVMHDSDRERLNMNEGVSKCKLIT